MPRQCEGPGGAVPQWIHTELTHVPRSALRLTAKDGGARSSGNHEGSVIPDPQVNSSGIEMQLPKGLQPNSPVFRAAQQACKKLMPGLP